MAGRAPGRPPCATSASEDSGRDHGEAAEPGRRRAHYRVGRRFMGDANHTYRRGRMTGQAARPFSSRSRKGTGRIYRLSSWAGTPFEAPPRGSRMCGGFSAARAVGCSPPSPSYEKGSRSWLTRRPGTRRRRVASEADSREPSWRQTGPPQMGRRPFTKEPEQKAEGLAPYAGGLPPTFRRLSAPAE